MSKPEVFITLPMRNGSEFEVSEKMVNDLDPLYPAVNVQQTLREMRAWLMLNAHRRKTRRGMGAFISNWLSSEQAKHGTNLKSSVLGQCMWNLNGSRGAAPRCESGAVEERDGLRYCKAHLHAFAERVR